MHILFKKTITGCEKEKIRSFIDNIITELRTWKEISESYEYEFRLILYELIANGAFHGNKGLCNKKITATLQVVDNKTVDITIQDEGSGFDYSSIYAGLYPCDKNPFSERGRGLKLIKALCNEIKFNSKGNIVNIKKTLQ